MGGEEDPTALLEERGFTLRVEREKCLVAKMFILAIF